MSTAREKPPCGLEAGSRPRSVRSSACIAVDGTHFCADSRWLYRLFIGLDANFRLKRKKHLNERNDSGLNKGYAYIVEDARYKSFLQLYDKKIPAEKSTCHNHDALKLVDMKRVRGLDASGVATVECTRHNMKRPCSVGDLQVGER